MNRSRLNFIVDVIGAVAFILLMSTGFLISFVLLPKSRGGSGGAIWGLTRHEWGDVHFYIAMTLIMFIIVHLVLHWRWIVAMLKGRVLVAGAALLLFAALAAAPFFSPIDDTVQDEHEPAGLGRNRGEGRRSDAAPAYLEEGSHRQRGRGEW